MRKIITSALAVIALFASVNLVAAEALEDLVTPDPVEISLGETNEIHTDTMHIGNIYGGL